MNPEKNRASWYYGNYLGRVREWVVLAETALVGLLVIVVAVWGLYGLSVRGDRQACYRYGDITLHDVEFVNTHFMGWECFVRVDGHWALKEQIRVNGEQP